jgi:hypothetical protein
MTSIKDVIKVTYLVLCDGPGKGGSAQKQSNGNSTEYREQSNYGRIFCVLDGAESDWGGGPPWQNRPSIVELGLKIVHSGGYFLLRLPSRQSVSVE